MQKIGPQRTMPAASTRFGGLVGALAALYCCTKPTMAASTCFKCTAGTVQGESVACERRYNDKKSLRRHLKVDHGLTPTNQTFHDVLRRAPVTMPPSLPIGVQHTQTSKKVFSDRHHGEEI